MSRAATVPYKPTITLALTVTVALALLLIQVARNHRLLKDKIGTRFSEFRRCFRLIDDDSSGACDREELKFMLNGMFNLAIPERSLNRMIEIADADGDGLIRFDEFARIFTSNDIRDLPPAANTSLTARNLETIALLLMHAHQHTSSRS